jgi:hypothetical protein
MARKKKTTHLVIHGRQDLFAKIALVYPTDDSDKDDDFDGEH